MKFVSIEQFNNEFSHHGVLGMHWGVENGPPYPLDSRVSTGSRLKSGAKGVVSTAKKKSKIAVSKAITNRRIDNANKEEKKTKAKLENINRRVNDKKKVAEHKETTKYEKNVQPILDRIQKIQRERNQINRDPSMSNTMKNHKLDKLNIKAAKEKAKLENATNRTMNNIKNKNTKIKDKYSAKRDILNSRMKNIGLDKADLGRKLSELNKGNENTANDILKGFRDYKLDSIRSLIK